MTDYHWKRPRQPPDPATVAALLLRENRVLKATIEDLRAKARTTGRTTPTGNQNAPNRGEGKET